MNRNDLQKLARVRLKEARTLLEKGDYDGAYYLCGYFVECGLKACVAKSTQRHDFPDKKKVQDSYTHNISGLISVAGLEPDLSNEMQSDPVFGRNWAYVKDWTEESRYKFSRKNKPEQYIVQSQIENMGF